MLYFLCAVLKCDALLQIEDRGEPPVRECAFISMGLLYVFLLLHIVLAVECTELTPDNVLNVTATDRTIGGGTWSAFFRIVIATTEYGHTENNDAEIQLVYHEYNGGFDYGVIANSPHMSDIYTCSVAHDPGRGYGHTTIYMTTNYQSGATCALRYNIYDVNGNVHFANPVFQYGKKQPKGKLGCSAPKPKADAAAVLKKKDVSVERNTKSTNICIPEASYSVGVARTNSNELCNPTEVNSIRQTSAHNCDGKLYMCDGTCATKARFPGKEKGWCINF